MPEFNIDSHRDIALMGVFAADFAIYWVFFHIVRMANAMRRHEIIAPRLFGCLGILIITSLFMWFARTNLIDPVVYQALSPREQGEYLGGLLRIAVFPAIVITAIAAARGWRDAQERKYRDKNTTT